MKWLGALSLLALVGCRANVDLDNRAYLCTPDGGNGLYGVQDPQCPAGWRCGLEGFCHDRNDAGPWQCISDLNCEGGWRCSFEGVCVDAKAEAVTDGLPATSVERVNPKWLPGRPDFFAASPLFIAPASLVLVDGGSLATARTFAVVSDGGLYHGFVGTAADGTNAFLPFDRILLPEQPLAALAEWNGLALVAQQNGALDVFQYDGGAWQLPWPGFAPKGLRVGGCGSDNCTDPLLVAFSDTQIALANFAVPDCSQPDQEFPPSSAPTTGVLPFSGGASCIQSPTGSCERINDVTVLGAGDALLAATQGGLYVAMREQHCQTQFLDDTGAPTPKMFWIPIDTALLPNDACGGVPAGSSCVERFHGNYANGGLAAEVGPCDSPGADAGLVSFAFGFGFQPSGTCPGLNQFPIDTFLPSACPACPAGESLQSVSLAEFTGPNDPNTRFPVAEVQCGITATSSEWHEIDLVNQCATEELGTDLISDLGAEDVSTAGVPSRAGNHGQLWFVDTSANPVASALLGASVADSVTNASSADWASTPDFVFGDQGQLSIGAGAGLWQLSPGFGFEQASPTVCPTGGNPVAGVLGQPDWVVCSQGIVTDIGRQDAFGNPCVVALLDRNVEALRAPLFARTVGLAGGRSELLISSFDEVLAADVTAAASESSDGGASGCGLAAPALIDLGTVPLARTPIISFTAFGSDGGSDLLSGYALTFNGLAQFRAITTQHWVSQPVPLAQGDWLAVVSDGAHGRVGYRDGRVYSFPSQVLVGPAFGDGSTAGDYAFWCGELYAVATSGLYALLPGANGDGAGQWSLVDLSAAQFEWTPDQGFGSARLYPTPRELDVFTQYGTVYRLSGCPVTGLP